MDRSFHQLNQLEDILEGWFDGCCEPINPGGTASYGAVLFRNKERIWEESKIVTVPPDILTSNNVAEYTGFIAILYSLLCLRDFPKHAPIIIKGDSMLVVEQMNGRWQMRGGHYVRYAVEAKRTLKAVRKRFKNIRIEWIPREQNSLADELSKCILDKAGVEFKLQPR